MALLTAGAVVLTLEEGALAALALDEAALDEAAPAWAVVLDPVERVPDELPPVAAAELLPVEAGPPPAAPAAGAVGLDVALVLAAVALPGLGVLVVPLLVPALPGAVLLPLLAVARVAEPVADACPEAQALSSSAPVAARAQIACRGLRWRKPLPGIG